VPAALLRLDIPLGPTILCELPLPLFLMAADTLDRHFPNSRQSRQPTNRTSAPTVPIQPAQPANQPQHTTDPYNPPTSPVIEGLRANHRVTLTLEQSAALFYLAGIARVVQEALTATTLEATNRLLFESLADAIRAAETLGLTGPIIDTVLATVQADVTAHQPTGGHRMTTFDDEYVLICVALAECYAPQHRVPGDIRRQLDKIRRSFKHLTNHDAELDTLYATFLPDTLTWPPFVPFDQLPGGTAPGSATPGHCWSCGMPLETAYCRRCATR
jgi:hypothetical protein